MKALEKERTRRYDTASALADDVERFLVDEPIEARPPSTAYRLRKVASRHRVALATTAAAALTVLAATVTSSWLAVRAIRGERRALAILAELWEERADRARDAAFSNDLQGARDAIEKARSAGAPPDLLQTLNGIALLSDRKGVEAVEELEKAADDNPNSLSALFALFWAYNQVGRLESWEIDSRLAEGDWSPKSRYEELFLCLHQSVLGSPEKIKKIIARLDNIIANRSRWGVAYAIRASARMEYAMESNNLEDFRKAVDDVEKAEEILPRSQYVDGQAIYVLTTAIQCAEHQHSAADAKRWRDLGEEIAAKFQPENWFRLANFYQSTGQTERAQELEAEGEKRERGHRGLESTPWAAMLFRQHAPKLEQELRAELDRVHVPPVLAADAESCLAFVLAHKSPSGRRPWRYSEDCRRRTFRMFSILRCWISRCFWGSVRQRKR